VLAGAPAAALPDGVQGVAGSESALVALAAAAADDTLVAVLASGTVPHREVELARAAATGDHVVVVDDLLPVSRTVLLAEAVARLGDVHAPGVLLAALPELRGRVAPRVVLSSVGSLQDPSPGLVQHASGWLPGSRFVSDMRQVFSKAHPERVTAGDPHAVVLHGRGPLSEAWAAELAEEAGVEVTPVQWDGHGPWGCRHWAELAVWEQPLPELVREVLSGMEEVRCAWCGRTVVADRECPFCRSVVEPVVGRTS
jgi:hypothetical protein